MILESALLQVKAGQTDAFEAAFAQASAIIASMPGYCWHELHRCQEYDHRYLLLVQMAHTGRPHRGLPRFAAISTLARTVTPLLRSVPGRLALRRGTEYAPLSVRALLRYDALSPALSAARSRMTMPLPTQRRACKHEPSASMPCARPAESGYASLPR